MARERYLIGVNPEELQEQKKSDTPLTPWQTFKLFCYNYRVLLIFLIIVLVLSVFVGVLIGSREKVDYTLVLVTQGKIGQVAVEELEVELENYGMDLDKDGHINVRILPLAMTDEGDYVELSTLFSSGNAVMFAMEPTYYKAQIEDWEEGDDYYFSTLNVEHKGLAEHGRYWNWKGSLTQSFFKETYPSDLCFGVRRATGTASGREEDVAACVTLLEKFIKESDLETSE